MRTHRPSDAQARFLACLDHHRANGEPVLASRSGTTVALYIESDDHGPLHGVDTFVEIDLDYPAFLHATMDTVRYVTVTACGRHRQWVTKAADPVRITTQHLGVCWTFEPKDYELTRLSITDDGRIALGRWRQEKAATPPPELPPLAGRDREVIAAAYVCKRLGYAMVPLTDDTKRESRRLSKGEYAERGWGGGSATLALEPSAIGAVEIDPAAADTPFQERIVMQAD